MRCLGWLVASLLALTVVAMDAEQSLTGLADKLRGMRLSSETEPFEPSSSSSRSGTTLNSAAEPYQPRRDHGKGLAAAHLDPATVDTTQIRLEAASDSLKKLIRTTQVDIGILGPEALTRIKEAISATLPPYKWAPGAEQWTRDKMPAMLARKEWLVKAFDDLFTQLEAVWALEPELEDFLERLEQLYSGIAAEDLRTLYQASEDLKALALLWNRKSELEWPRVPTVGPALSNMFADHNDAHLVALGRTIRDQVGAIIEPVPRITALERPEFTPSHWPWEWTLVKSFEKRRMDLDTLYFSSIFDPKLPEIQAISHRKLVGKRRRLQEAQRSIRLGLDPADRPRFQNLLERITSYDATARSRTYARTVLTAPHQPRQASPGKWAVARGTSQGPWIGQVQHGVVIPNHQGSYGSAHSIAQPQPGGHYGGYPIGYPGGHPVGYPEGYPGGHPGGAPRGPHHLPNPGYDQHGRWYGPGRNA